MKSFDNRPTVREYPGGNEQYMVVFLKVLYWDFYYFLFTFMWKKQTHHFGIQRMNKTWRYSHLNKATFIAPPVSSIPPNFHRYGVLYSGTIYKKIVCNYYWFFTILLLWYHLNLLCDLDYVCLSFMILNVKWNLLIISQRWRSTTGEMSNTWWCSSRFCTGTSTISYLHWCEKNKHAILEFSGWTKLEVTHI